MKHTIFSLILLFISTSIFAARKEILLNENWMFRFSHQVQFKSEERVNLPHTWNSGDALSGKQDYYRGMGNYTKTLFVKPEWKGKRLFLRFEGVNTIANVFINDVHIGEHRGGYGAFVFEITDKVKYDADNRILVKVNNALQQDVMPLVGDFNFYGGIYRPHHDLTDDAGTDRHQQRDVRRPEDRWDRRRRNGNAGLCPAFLHHRDSVGILLFEIPRSQRDPHRAGHASPCGDRLDCDSGPGHAHPGHLSGQRIAS